MNTNKKNHKLVSNSEITTPRHLSKSRRNKPSYNFRAIASVALLFFLITGSTFSLQAQVNESSYVELNVQSGKSISLSLYALPGTPIKIVSGSSLYNVTSVGGWLALNSYMAGASTMTIYGDFSGFDCGNNESRITGIDISHNTELKTLKCFGNQISSLDVSQNTELTDLLCSYNQISSLNVSQNTELTKLKCSHNQINSLNVSQNTKLKWFKCSSNQISYLDVSQNTELLYLDCGYNQISTLDVTQNTKLTHLTCRNNDLSKLNVKKNTKLVSLYCNENEIKDLNLLKNNDLMVLQCELNELESLDVSSNMKLTELYCAYNSIKELYVSPLVDLERLSCYENQLNILDVSENTELTHLHCGYNQLRSLNLGQNMKLTEIRCYKNSFTKEAIDHLFCSLPDRNGLGAAKIYVLRNENDADSDIVLETNKQNAIDKNWEVLYYNDTDIPATTGTYVCGTVNMERYITITVQENEDIMMNLLPDYGNAPIKIISGTNEYDITLDVDCPSTVNYTSGASTMTIYGNITYFDCSFNEAKITGLDVSHNTALEKIFCSENQISTLDVSQNTKLNLLSCEVNKLNSLDISQNTKLRELYCSENQISALDVSQNPDLEAIHFYKNPFTTSTIDELFCTLPVREVDDEAVIHLLQNESDDNYDKVVATNSQNATNKNWSVLYYYSATDIVTTGTYMCGLNMYRYITLDVQNGADIELELWADVDNTPISIVSGSEHNITVGVDCCPITLTAEASTMIIYGDIKKINCGHNLENITGLDVSQNKKLKGLGCHNNRISSLDISQNTELEYFSCSMAPLKTVDVSNNTKLTELFCSMNQLTTLDISQNTKLTRLNCYGNKLTSLDISPHTALAYLDCGSNNLTNLDISHNPELVNIQCYKNKFSTEVFDALFCSLPDREIDDDAQIIPLSDEYDANKGIVEAANKQNATDKNWSVLYWLSDNDIETLGDYECGSSTSEVYLSDLILYPNPVTDGFTIETQERGVLEIYSVTGQKVGSVQITNNKQFIDVNNLQSGVYFAKINGRVVKFAKR